MEKTIITKYTLSTDYNIKIAHISDLHEKNPNAVIEALRKIQPDVILSSGDLLERREDGALMADGTVSPWTSDIMREWQGKDYSKFKTKLKDFLYFRTKKDKISHADNTYALLGVASTIAPTFISSGNHEWYYIKEDVDVFDKCRIQLLDNADITFTKGGKAVRIGGLPTRHNLQWFKEYSEKDGYKILLMHHPEYYEKHIKNKCDNFNLILSGHVHGGQWRFFNHAVVAPGQGLNPKYHHGLYNTGGGVMEVSAGLANTVKAPRFGNPCEVVEIEI